MDAGALPPPGPPGLQQDEELCYCGKGSNLSALELQCTACSRWYHADCTSCYMGTCIPFMCNYIYSCKYCNADGLESFQKKQASFQQICYTTLANLTYMAKCRGESRVMFSRDKEIIPFIEKQWESMTTMPRRVKLTWHNTVHKTLAKETDIFFGNETAAGDIQFGLLNPDLYKVTPAFEILTKSNTQIQTTQKPGIPVDKGLRGQKRKAAQESLQQVSTKVKKGDVLNVARLAPHGYPTEHPFNKDGYRYILAEPDPHAPNRQAYDESVEWAGKPIPGYLYRTFLGSEILLALHDRAPQLKISENRLTVTGEKGYSMVRATHGVRRGSWFYEVIIEEMPDNTATRIGWSQMLGNLQAPCGYDKFSYSWRSRKGSRFHSSRGKNYSNPYKEGDVLGFHISLPDPRDPHDLLPQTCKDKDGDVIRMCGLHNHIHRTGEVIKLRVIITNNSSIPVQSLRIKLLRKTIFMCKQPVLAEFEGDENVDSSGNALDICVEKDVVVGQEQLIDLMERHELDSILFPLKETDGRPVCPTVRCSTIECAYRVCITANLANGSSFDTFVPVPVINAVKNRQWRTWVAPFWVLEDDIERVPSDDRCLFRVPENLLCTEAFSSIPGFQPL